MAVVGKFSLAVLLLSLLVLFAGLAFATTDPELKECKHQCKHQRQYDEDQKRECLDRCEKYYKEKEEQERKGEGRREEGRGTERRDEKMQESCESPCEWLSGEGRALCRLRCRMRYEKDHHGREEEKEGRKENPYVFEERHFTSKARSEHGRLDVLQKFTEESGVLRGIENYRVAVVEAAPQTFVSPTHWDSDTVLFVASGRGTITGIQEEKRRSFNVEEGDVMRVSAGTPVYVINRDEDERLFIVSFLRPVNIPGETEAFRAPGSQDHESFYSAFSWELLEAALKTDRRKLERILNQNQEIFTKASKEQIQGMSQREEGAGIWPFRGESSGPYNLLHERPVQSNNHGQLYEVDRRYYEQQLEDLDISVSFANITRGSMIGPYYNSRATKVAVVVDGEGYFEMACPHVGRESQTGSTYQKISSRLRRGTVFIVPAGHPVASVASRNSNLQVLCFEVNARGNTRYTLAGKNNIVNKMEREAKELAFGVREREVDQVFGSQSGQWFFPGPRQHQWEGRADA